MVTKKEFRSTAIHVLFFSLFFIGSAQATWRVHQTRTGKTVKIVRVQKTESAAPKGGSQVVTSLPQYLSEDGALNGTVFEEVLFSDDKLPKEEVDEDGWWDDLFGNPDVDWKAAEVRTLVNQGPKENRIHLTIVGDGYTMAEKNRFFEDAQRTTDELFKEHTFAVYLPLFNVHAVFVPSNESGLTDVTKKKTAFGLYRSPKGSKRAILPGHSGNINKAIGMAPASDFPILLANDDFYGGLGGEYAITTRSVESGAMVLRHELGHNFGNVGEEYDGGQVYTGANFSSSASNPGWKKWLNGPTPGKIEDTKYLDGRYAWQNLNGKPFRSEFDFPTPTSNGNYSFEVLISSVGWASAEDVEVRLDGVKVEIEGTFTADRSFYKIKNLVSSLAPGRHTVDVEEKIHDGDNVLAFVQVYAHEATHDFTANRIGLFPTFNENGSFVGYRPTHEGCLMRNMLSKNFCAADIENMWVRFLNRVSLVDSLTLTSGTVQLKTPAIADLSIDWFFEKASGDRVALPELKNKATWETKGFASGSYTARVHFETAQVRNPTDKFTVEKSIQL